MVRRAITVEDLLNQWHLRKLAYIQQAMVTRDPAHRAVIKTMMYQLDKCIDELTAVLHEDYPRMDLLGIILDNKDEDA